MTSNNEAQLAGAVLMIRPVRFHSNPLTAASNTFQGDTTLSADEQQRAALQEFEGVARSLEAAGVEVVVVDDTEEPPTPDSVFPNNWVTFHRDGTVVLYPMEAVNRRTERRQDIIRLLVDRYGFHVRRIIDLSPHERYGHYLEGTGSLVLDRAHRIAYACLSSRTHLDALGDFAQRMDYDVLTFEAVDRQGAPIYHTNVMMNLGERVAVICLEAIRRDDQRLALERSLETTGHTIIAINYDQLEHFAGNMLELRAANGGRVMAMSASARESLSPAQLAAIEDNATIVSVPIDRIEASSGGSVRCMLAEIHLPRG